MPRTITPTRDPDHVAGTIISDGEIEISFNPRQARARAAWRWAKRLGWEDGTQIDGWYRLPFRTADLGSPAQALARVRAYLTL